MIDNSKLELMYRQLYMITERDLTYAYTHYVNLNDQSFDKDKMVRGLILFFSKETNQDQLLELLTKEELSIITLSFLTKNSNDGVFFERFLYNICPTRITETHELLIKRLILFPTISEMQINALLEEKIIKYLCLQDFLDLPSRFKFTIGQSTNEVFITSNYALACTSLFIKHKKTLNNLLESDTPDLFPLLEPNLAKELRNEIFIYLDKIAEGESNLLFEKSLKQEELMKLISLGPLEFGIEIISSGYRTMKGVLSAFIETLRKLDTLTETEMLNVFSFYFLQVSRQFDAIPFFLNKLLKFGIINFNDGCIKINPQLVNYTPSSRSNIIETSATTFYFYGDLTESDIIFAYLGKATKVDVITSFEIDYNSYTQFVKAFKNHDTFLKQFDSTNLKLTLQSFANQMNRVIITEGVLFESNDPILSTIILNNEELKPYILRVVTPNAFLLDKSKQKEWQTIVKKFLKLNSNILKSEKKAKTGKTSLASTNLDTEPSPLVLIDFSLPIKREIPIVAEKRIKELLLAASPKPKYRSSLFPSIEKGFVINESYFPQYFKAEEVPESKKEIELTLKKHRYKKRFRIKVDGQSLIVDVSKVENNQIKCKVLPNGESKVIDIVDIQEIKVI